MTKLAVHDVAKDVRIENLRRKTLLDSLTKLPGRAWLDHQITERIKTTERKIDEAIIAGESNPEESFFLLLMDFDNFKRYNDQANYNTGDEILKLMAMVPTRPGEEIARFGGDEFAQTLNSGITDEEATRVTERNAATIREKSREMLLKNKSAQDAGITQATISIALVKFRPGMTARDMIEIASNLIHEAKKTDEKDTTFVSMDGGETSFEITNEDSSK